MVAAGVTQPMGTVTLVFTDVERSTQLLSELGEEDYQERLAEHRRVLRDAFGRHGGYEVDNAGDGFLFAFGSARGALEAVSETMATLDPGPIRIRVGVHTGEPVLDPPKYIGLDVHRAARIMAAGHGGQVLVSRSTRDALDGSFPLRDLGEHRLKDFAEPVRLYQLGEERFAPLRTLFLSNVPTPATAFVGRERERAELVELLRDGVRLLTLTGPGGTGKTRLAVSVADELRDGFRDGVWWVPLAPLRDARLVLAEVARTLGITGEPGRDLADTLAVALSGRKLLLLLDNAEHLLPDVAETVLSLSRPEGPTLLVTSRERLQLGAEQVYPVPPLASEEGIELFVSRAQALDPGFRASGAVEELCVRLDNLPLAIELAAGRTPALSVEQILDRLGRRLDLLAGGRDADPRQRTLRATIEWSYLLLDAAERDLFENLSVFADGCMLEAAEEVSAAEVETLASLVDKSLVRRSDDRHWLLETIREYAGG
jgi:predicted ATPase/class 3 adenylate cyclase